jgi:hypothetical protein
MSDSKNGAAANGRNGTATADGRESNGRFAAGNRGGPGNPFARQTAAARKAIADAVTAEQLAAIAAVMVKKALEGDVAAAKLVFAYAAGRPGAAPDPDTLDAHELAVRRGNVAPPEDVKALFEQCPASLLCAIAAVAAPQVREHLEAAFAQGVRRQGECEKRDRKHAPEAPGPYPGRKADWAPSVVRRGLSKEVEELFEACPAWMPDVTGADRLPHAYADALRSMRQSLLDELGAADAGPRRSVPTSVSKRVNRPGPATAHPL